VDEILREALAHEEEGVGEYHKLLAVVAGCNIMLGVRAHADRRRGWHLADLGKMLRKPGSIA
jgi:hypothetical protein